MDVALLTDGILEPFMRIWKERSRIALNFLDLCGIMAMGDILRLIGGSSLMSFHLITFANPPFILSLVS